jgi:hypothetical protein
VLPVSTVSFASLTALTIACFGNPLGTAKTADATSIEQTLANANKIDFMIHPYGFYDRSAIAIATQSYSDSTRESRGPIQRLSNVRNSQAPASSREPIIGNVPLAFIM